MLLIKILIANIYWILSSDHSGSQIWFCIPQLSQLPPLLRLSYMFYCLFVLRKIRDELDDSTPEREN